MSYMRCTFCNSQSVVRDAWAEWDGKDWVLTEVFDDFFCCECDTSCQVEEYDDDEEGQAEKSVE